MGGDGWSSSCSWRDENRRVGVGGRDFSRSGSLPKGVWLPAASLAIMPSWHLSGGRSTVRTMASLLLAIAPSWPVSSSPSTLVMRSHSISWDCAAGPPGTSEVSRFEPFNTMPKPCGPRSKRTVRVSTNVSPLSAAFAAATFFSLSLSSEVACTPPVPNSCGVTRFATT